MLAHWFLLVFLVLTCRFFSWCFASCLVLLSGFPGVAWALISSSRWSSFAYAIFCSIVHLINECQLKGMVYEVSDSLFRSPFLELSNLLARSVSVLWEEFWMSSLRDDTTLHCVDLSESLLTLLSGSLSFCVSSLVLVSLTALFGSLHLARVLSLRLLCVRGSGEHFMKLVIDRRSSARHALQRSRTGSLPWTVEPNFWSPHYWARPSAHPVGCC